MPYESAAAETEATGANEPTDCGQVREDAARDEPEQDADHEPDPELPHEQEEEVVEPEGRVLDPLDQADRERDRGRVVEAGLALERAGEAAPDLGVAQGREDGGGVGRRDDAAEEDRLRASRGRRARGPRRR